jgi:hypothetical protein
LSAAVVLVVQTTLTWELVAAAQVDCCQALQLWRLEQPTQSRLALAALRNQVMATAIQVPLHPH